MQIHFHKEPLSGIQVRKHSSLYIDSLRDQETTLFLDVTDFKYQASWKEGENNKGL